MNRRRGLTYYCLIINLTVFCFFNIAVKAEPAFGVNQTDLIYFIVTDRFLDGDPTNNANVRKNDPSAYHGGNFEGIIEKLDYIKELGFTAIWISPVVANQLGGYHGYWPVDFYQTNEHFGSLKKLRELVDQAHQRGLKVIIDLVLNHTGILHPWVNDPKYESWFHRRGNITDYNNQREVEEGRLAGLPDLDQENPVVRQYLIQMAKWWISQTGINGYRLDAVKHVPQSFWREFAREIKGEYPGFFLMGEVYDGRIDYVAEYQKAGIDGLVDYPLYYAIADVFGGYQPEKRLTDTLSRCAAGYPKPNLMGTFIDNHDVPRFINQLRRLPEERLQQALAFMMTYTGIPVMYYGTEIGLDGGADPDNRRDMDWSTQSPLVDFVKKLTMIRTGNPALTYGDFQVLSADPGFLCYLRQYENNGIVCCFNLSDKPIRGTFTIPSIKPSQRNQRNRLTGLLHSGYINLKNGKIRIKLSPRQVQIYRLSGD